MDRAADQLAEANDDLLAMAESYRAVGVTDVMLILHGEDPARLADQIGGLLLRLHAIG